MKITITIETEERRKQENYRNVKFYCCFVKDKDGTNKMFWRTWYLNIPLCKKTFWEKKWVKFGYGEMVITLNNDDIQKIIRKQLQWKDKPTYKILEYKEFHNIFQKRILT